MHQPVAFIGIGSKNEQEMQQLIIEDKVGRVSCLKPCRQANSHQSAVGLWVGCLFVWFFLNIISFITRTQILLFWGWKKIILKWSMTLFNKNSESLESWCTWKTNTLLLDFNFMSSFLLVFASSCNMQGNGYQLHQIKITKIKRLMWWWLFSGKGFAQIEFYFPHLVLQLSKISIY